MISAHAYSTGVGSLPFQSRLAAEEHVFSHYSLPFYPQLPQILEGGRTADVPVMFAEVLPMLGDTAPRAEFAAAAARHIDAWPGLLSFLRRAQQQTAFGPWQVKLQIAGPTGLAAWLASRADTAATVPTATACRDWCAALIRALARVARIFVDRALVVVDDALMMAAATDDDARWLRELNKELAVNGVSLGLHGCAEADLLRVTKTFSGLILAVDLSVVTSVGVLTSRDATAATILAEHGRAGGGFVFGVVDTRQTTLNPTRATAQVAFARAVFDQATLGAPKSASPFLLSGGCGTGLHSLAYEREVAEFLAAFTGT